VATPEPRPASRVSLPPLDINALTGRWDELLELLKTQGKPNILLAALRHSHPSAVNARGDVMIELDEPNDIYDRAVNDGRGDVLNILRGWFAGVERVHLKRDAAAQPAAPPKRLTHEMVRAERVASLRKGNPLLDAAIDTLDLDLVD